MDSWYETVDVSELNGGDRVMITDDRIYIVKVNLRSREAPLLTFWDNGRGDHIVDISADSGMKVDRLRMPD